MLKHRPTDYSHTCSPPDAFSDWTHLTVQEGTESNGYRGTGPGEQFGSVMSDRPIGEWRQESFAMLDTGQPRAPARVARQRCSGIGAHQTVQFWH